MFLSVFVRLRVKKRGPHTFVYCITFYHLQAMTLQPWLKSLLSLPRHCDLLFLAALVVESNLRAVLCRHLKKNVAEPETTAGYLMINCKPFG